MAAMVILHSSTIIALACAFAVLLALCFFAFAQIVTDKHLANRFALGNLAYALGTFCRLLDTESPHLMLISVAWVALPAGLAIQLSALRQMSGASSLDRQLLTGNLLHAGVLGLLTIVHGHEAWMAIPTVLATLAILALSAKAYDQFQDPSLVLIRWMMRATYGGIALLGVSQAMLRLASVGHAPNGQAIAVSQFGFALLFVMMNLGYIVTFLLAQQLVIGRLANADPLTQVLNRAGLEQRLARMLASGGRKLHGTLLLINIDRFKSINQSLGHSAGDAVLRDMGIALRARLRKGDLLARTSGEEFCLLLSGTHEAAAQVIAERLRLELSQRSIAAGDIEQVNVTVSIGIAAFVLDEPCIDEVLQRADIALFMAKANGRNRTETWSPKLEALIRAQRLKGATEPTSVPSAPNRDKPELAGSVALAARA